MADRLRCCYTEYWTPLEVVRAVDHLLGGIELDPCAPFDENPVGARRTLDYYADGLGHPWDDRTYVNPPYGKQIRAWTEKLSIETWFGFRMVALLPIGDRLGTHYYQENVVNGHLTAICFIRKRLRFRLFGVTAGPSMHSSGLFCYNLDPDRAKEVLGCLGKVISCS